MAQVSWLLNTQVSILADETQTESHYDLIHGTFSPGVETPPHLHRNYSELVFVLRGEFTIYTNEETVILGPGQSHFIPKGRPHVVAASSAEPAIGLTVASPSGFAKLIRELGTKEPSADAVDPELLKNFMKLSVELGDEILGLPGSRPPFKS